MSGAVLPKSSLKLLWTHVVLVISVALIFVIAITGRLGFTATEKPEMMGVIG